MEFVAGIIFTLVVGFIGYRAFLLYRRRKERAEYIPPAGSGLDRPIKPNPDAKTFFDD